MTKVKLPGTHRVSKRLASGRTAIYWYRYRGGPFLAKFEGATRAEAERAEREGATALAAAYAQPAAQPVPVHATMRYLVQQYRGSPQFGRLKASTQRTWRPWLDRIEEAFGDLPLKALKARGARRAFIEWRDSRSGQPRTADLGTQVLRRVLSWGLDRELVEANPAEGIGNLYRNNRADEIVEPHELEAILQKVTPAAALAIRLAAETGMRRGDLIGLKWDHVDEVSLEFPTAKSNGKRRALVPLFEGARAVVAELREQREQCIREGRVPSAYVLVTERGKPWARDSLTQAFARAADALGIEKTLHDLRGTAVTRMLIDGLSDVQVAEIVGWEPSRVSSIRKRYASRARIVQGVIEQLERAKRTG